MRKIKFRVFDKVSGEISDPFALFGEFTLLGAVFAWLGYVRNDAKVCCGLEDLNDLTIMQYTGLKDKNGVEIYEGDVLLTDGGVYRVGYEAPSLYLVNVKGYYYMPDDDECPGSFSCLYDWGSFEVIGNIYENPELINQ